MRRPAWLLPGVGLLALSACFLTVARGRDEDDDKEKMKAAAKAAPDVQKLADAVGDAAALKKQADAITSKYELSPIMWQMKPREKNGLGVGAKPGAIDPDGIESKLLEMGGTKRPVTAKDLKANKDDYQRMAEVIRGIAEATPPYASKYAKTKAEEKVWNGLVDDMKKGSEDMDAAVKAGDLKATQKAIGNLTKSCNDCHTKFRDN